MILSQKQTQQLVLSPALKQSLHILQLPLTSLQEHLNDISLENPMLELTPSDPEVPNWREDLSGLYRQNCSWSRRRKDPKEGIGIASFYSSR